MRRQRRMIDIMDDFKELVRIDAVLLHQPAQARPVAPVQILLQPKRLVVRDFQETRDVVADAYIDLLPKIEMMRIERVVEIEDPGLDRAEAANGPAHVANGLAASLALIHSRRL